MANRETECPPNRRFGICQIYVLLALCIKDDRPSALLSIDCRHSSVVVITLNKFTDLYQT